MLWPNTTNARWDKMNICPSVIFIPDGVIRTKQIIKFIPRLLLSLHLCFPSSHQRGCRRHSSAERKCLQKEKEISKKSGADLTHKANTLIGVFSLFSCMSSLEWLFTFCIFEMWAFINAPCLSAEIKTLEGITNSNFTHIYESAILYFDLACGSR